MRGRIPQIQVGERYRLEMTGKLSKQPLKSLRIRFKLVKILMATKPIHYLMRLSHTQPAHLLKDIDCFNIFDRCRK